jgi:signal transduction histidine kinase
MDDPSIVLESNKYATERGSSIAKITRKQKETALIRLENHEKRCTAGLLASSGEFSLGLGVLEHQRHSKQMEEEKQRQKQLIARDLHDVLLVKVQAIRSKNLPAEKWTSSELNTMIQWHK